MRREREKWQGKSEGEIETEAKSRDRRTREAYCTAGERVYEMQADKLSPACNARYNVSVGNQETLQDEIAEEERGANTQLHKESAFHCMSLKINSLIYKASC